MYVGITYSGKVDTVPEKKTQKKVSEKPISDFIIVDFDKFGNLLLTN